MDSSALICKIEQLKEKRDAVILAHYYVKDVVQKAADYVGDSYYLSKIATKLSQKVICFAGVRFMAESAKILNPKKIVLMPENEADCPMAHMVDIKKINTLKNKYSDLKVVCYINSTAEVKEHSDVCVTSANAVDIVRKIDSKNIYFIPDRNLGSYVAKQVPEKNIILNDGYCHVHNDITLYDIHQFKKNKNNIKVLVHPECTHDVLSVADYIGSTSGIIKYATESKDNEFLICTEEGVLHELRAKNPNKKFYTVENCLVCPDMKKITLEKIISCLENISGEITIEEEKRKKAEKCLTRMLELAK